MSDFWLWFYTGLRHILDWNGYDHIMYIIVLCVMFSFKAWQKLLILITAFTIGHSVTLVMSILHIIQIKQSYIEVLIPITILLTCVVNIYSYKRQDSEKNAQSNYIINYILAILFGFIHGMGFSYLLKSLLGKEESVLSPLLFFNLGLEAGQLIIVVCMLLISVFLIRFTTVKKSTWILFISSAVFGISFLLLIQRLNTI